MQQSLAWAVIIAGILSMGVNAVVVWASRRSGNLSQRDDLNAVQSAHSRPTARLGGLGVFLGFGAASSLLSYTSDNITPILLLLSASPVFLAGLLEDVGRRVSPRGRLLTAIVSAGTAIIVLDLWIGEVGLTGLDYLLAITPIAFAVTMFWSAGVCNALNLVDGVNGLAGFIAIFISVALGYIANNAGDILMGCVAIVLAAALLGFLVFNWPAGKVFLGDAGAYSIGHLLVWTSVTIAWRNPSFSYAAVSLLFFWPVADTFLAMWRRSRRRRSMMHPDYLHVHQFVMRAIQLRWRMPLPLANSATVIVIFPFFLPPIIASVLLLEHPRLAFTAWIGFGIAFTSLYLVGIRWVRRQKWRSTRQKQATPIGHNPGWTRR